MAARPHHLMEYSAELKNAHGRRAKRTAMGVLAAAKKMGAYPLDISENAAFAPSLISSGVRSLV